MRELVAFWILWSQKLKSQRGDQGILEDENFFEET